jgi:hypothetical protein
MVSTLDGFELGEPFPEVLTKPIRRSELIRARRTC